MERMPAGNDQSMVHVGIDVGGSALKVGVLSAEICTGTPADLESAVLWEESVPVAKNTRFETVFDDLVALLKRRLVGYTIDRIGIGLPGALNRERGVIEMSPNLTWLIGVDVRAELCQRLGGFEPASIHLENDANVAALGEQTFGGGAGLRDLMFVTLGTGVGSGLILDGKLFVGAGFASEVGHLCVEPDGIPCGCGSQGCLETLASASSTERRARELNLPPESPGDLVQLTEIAREKDGPERDLLLAVGRDLGHGLAAVAVLIDVRTFVFGGGFSAALDILAPGILRGINERAYVKRPFELLRANLGNRAGWLGAARLGQD
ncbi:MAG: glucokinase [Planctomycetota bacterium]|jgi:glucokinase